MQTPTNKTIKSRFISSKSEFTAISTTKTSSLTGSTNSLSKPKGHFSSSTANPKKHTSWLATKSSSTLSKVQSVSKKTARLSKCFSPSPSRNRNRSSHGNQHSLHQNSRNSQNSPCSSSYESSSKTNPDTSNPAIIHSTAETSNAGNNTFNENASSKQEQCGALCNCLSCGLKKREGAIIYSPRARNTNTVPNNPSSSKITRQKSKSYDRFISTRPEAITAQFHLKENATPDSTVTYLDNESLAYQEIMAKACGVALEKRILSFAVDPPVSERHELSKNWNRPMRPKSSATRRRIPLAPEKILDAPGLIDDYYLNLLAWSSKNLLAVGLENTVYVWNGDTGKVQEFCRSKGDDYIASLKWASDGSYLAVGLGSGDAQIWDVDSASKIRSMRGHTARIGVLSWDQHILSSGCRDGSIWNHDVRIASHKIAELCGHTAEVCGLEWRPDGAMLASGGNDNLVQIWDARSSLPRMTKTDHNAAALAWCPWQLSLLATGGGKLDNKVHFWNTSTHSRVNTVHAGSQVTSIQWSVSYKEFVTSHGFPDNQLSVWAYPSLSKIADLPGHDARILGTARSPDGETIVSSASDENLKFWKVFERTKGAKEFNKKNAGANVSEMEDDLLKSYDKMTIR